MADDLEELIASATSRVSRKTKCWAKVASDPILKEYIRILSELEAQERYSVSRREVARTLNRRFGVQVGRDLVNRHFNGECVDCYQEEV